MGGAKRRYSSGQETILFFTKSRNHTFNYDDIRVPYESEERINHAKEKGILKTVSVGFLIQMVGFVVKYGISQVNVISLK